MGKALGYEHDKLTLPQKIDYFGLSGYGFLGDLSLANDDKTKWKGSDYGWLMQQQSEDLTDQQGWVYIGP